MVDSSQRSDPTKDRPGKKKKKIKLTFIVPTMAAINTQERIISNSLGSPTGGKNIKFAGKRKGGDWSSRGSMTEKRASDLMLA